MVYLMTLSSYTALNGRKTLNDELERMGKKALEVLTTCASRESEKP
jgi:hypothetical protein